MRDSFFPAATVWLLDDGEEAVVLQMNSGDTALLIFTDDDLATTYAEKAGITGKAKRVIGAPNIHAMLLEAQQHGVTHIAVDATPGKRSPAGGIDKAIQEAAQQISRFPSPPPDND